MKKKFYIILAIVTLSTLISSRSNDSIQETKVKNDDFNKSHTEQYVVMLKSENKAISLVGTIISITNEIPDSDDVNVKGTVVRVIMEVIMLV
jgi:exonuclease III